MKRILTFIAIAILLCTTAFATITSQDGVLTITNENLTNNQASTVQSSYSNSYNVSVPATGSESYPEYVNASVKCTNSGTTVNYEISGSSGASGSSAADRRYNELKSAAYSICQTIGVGSHRYYFNYGNGLTSQIETTATIQTTARESAIILTNTIFNGQRVASYYFTPNIYFSIDHYWGRASGNGTATAHPRLVVDIVRVAASDLSVSGCTFNSGVTGTCSNLDIQDTAIGTCTFGSVSGAANLQRVTQCVAKQSGGAGF